MLRLLDRFGHFTAVGLHGVKKGAPVAGELVGELGFHAAGKAPAVVGFGLPFHDVFAAALHEVAGQLLAQRVVGRGAALQAHKGRVEQGQQVVERGFVARVRGGGEQQQVALGVFGQALQQLKAQLLARATAGAGVGFVHDDAFGGDAQEVLAVAFAFDVVEADHHDGVLVEQAHAVRQVALDAAGAGRCKGHGLQVEAVLQFALPLLDQVWRAQHGQAGDFAPVDEFAGNQPGLDGFADTHVVRNQQADGGQPQGHEQRHQLVGARLDGNVAKRAERPAARAQLEAQGIAQQQRCGMVAGLLGVGPGKRGGGDGLEFKLGDEGDDVFVRTAQGAQAQQAAPVALVGVGLHHPFAATGTHQVAGEVVKGVGGHAKKSMGLAEDMGVAVELVWPLAWVGHVEHGLPLVHQRCNMLCQRRREHHDRARGLVLACHGELPPQGRNLVLIGLPVAARLQGLLPLGEQVV